MKLFKILLSVILIVSFLIYPVEAKTPWTSKPPIGSRINWGHPLSKGLVGCWLMNEGGGLNTKDIATNKNCAIESHSNWKHSIKDKTLNFDGNYSYVSFTSKAITPLVSIFAVVNNDAISSTSYPRIIQMPNYFMFLADEGTKGVKFSGRGGTWNTDAGNLWTYDTWFSIGGTYNESSDNNNPTIYCNGKSVVVTKDVSPGRIVTNAGTGYLGNRDGTGNHDRPFDGMIACVYVWERILSPQEIKQLYIDPYCFIKPQTDWNCIKSAVVTTVINIMNKFNQGFNNGFNSGFN